MPTTVVVRRKHQGERIIGQPVNTQPAVTKPVAPITPITPMPKNPYNKQQRRNYKRNQKIRQSEAFVQIAKEMVKRWPQVFLVTKTTIRPLAIGISADLCSQLPEFASQDVRNALHMWFRHYRNPYLKAIARGGKRYDLLGSPRGEVTSEEQQHAEETRKRWRASQKERAKISQGRDSTQDSNPLA